jgi:hypothetical protein
MSRATFLRGVLVLVGAVLPLFLGELVLRSRSDAMTDLRDLRPGPWENWGSFDEYDSVLGWVPRANSSVTRRAGWSASIDDHGFRRNRAPHETSSLAVPPILAVGDSGVFGDEVDDHETWPAQLEFALGRRVLNAGVSAYGIDQAVLRAERLYPEYKPAVVVLSVVSDDVTRTALRFWNRWKPYFEVRDGRLHLTEAPRPNVPLPDPWWRTALGHSHTAGFGMRRAFPEAWEHRVRRRAHGDEVEVSGMLLGRLQEFVDARGGRLLIVLTAGGNGDVRHIDALRNEAVEHGGTVLDLADELARFARDPDENARMFRPAYHPSPAGNAWIADRIAARLLELGWLHDPSEE